MGDEGSRLVGEVERQETNGNMRVKSGWQASQWKG